MWYISRNILVHISNTLQTVKATLSIWKIYTVSSWCRTWLSVCWRHLWFSQVSSHYRSVLLQPPSGLWLSSHCAEESALTGRSMEMLVLIQQRSKQPSERLLFCAKLFVRRWDSRDCFQTNWLTFKILKHTENNHNIFLACHVNNLTFI